MEQGKLKIYSDIDNSNVDSLLYHDINGNVYIVVNNLHYMIDIDKHNDISIENVNLEDLYKFSTDNIIFKKISHTEFSTLKKKTLEKIENDSESDQDENYQNFKQNIKYLNEDKYYYSEYEYEECNDDDEKFDFYKNNDNTIKLINYGSEVPAIYDTFIRDKDKNVIASLIFNNENGYRISLYDDIIELNIIGDKIISYRLYYNNLNNIYLKKVNIKNLNI